MKKLIIRLIHWYQYFISPMTMPSCRFHPSCSQYAREAINRYGAGKGALLTINRICRCHPFCHGGYDPVP